MTGPGTGAPAGLRISYLLAASGGGTGRHVAMLADGCAARGATVHVYGPAAARAGLAQAGGAQPGWDFSVVDIAAGPRPARDLAAVLRVRRLVARDRPGVLHAHGLRAGALAALALAAPGTPRTMLAVTVHNAPPAAGPAAAVYAGLELIVARRADAVLTVSGDLAARMSRRGARLAGRALVPAPAAPAASPAEIAALRRELAGGEFAGGESRGRELAGGESGGRVRRPGARGAADRARGGPAGRPERFRHADPGRRAVAAAAGGSVGGHCGGWAAGRGTPAPGRAWPGWRSGSSARATTCRLSWVPPTWWSSRAPGRASRSVVQEALRAGRPLVATRVGGMADLTGDDGAVLVPPGDPVALAAAVTRILDDPEAAARLAAAARGRAALLPTETAAVDQVLGVYEAMTSRP